MGMVSERKPTTVRQLYETVTAYIDDNKHSRDAAERWLCSTLEVQLGTISGVLNNRPREADRPAIASFEASEIQQKITAKRKEIENLERDLRAAQKATA